MTIKGFTATPRILPRIAERLRDFQREGMPVAWVEVGPGVMDGLRIELAHVQATRASSNARRVLGTELRENLALPVGAIEPVQANGG